jgi:hypothetical protein
MAVWSWANVASPVRSSTKARTHLSICPTDPLVGQVDRLAATVMQPFVEERVSSPSTASLPVANLAGFQNFDSPGNDATRPSCSRRCSSRCPRPTTSLPIASPALPDAGAWRRETTYFCIFVRSVARGAPLATASI